MFVHNHKPTKVNSLRLFLSLALIATVASVPTSVLVQNSELASNAQQNRQNSNQIYNGISSSSSNINKGKFKKLSFKSFIKGYGQLCDVSQIHTHTHTYIPNSLCVVSFIHSFITVLQLHMRVYVYFYFANHGFEL